MPLEINTPEFIEFLFRTGHFFNPAFPNTGNITLADLQLLALSDQVVKDAVASFQKADGNFDIVSTLVHRRPISTDGDVGPVTQFMSQAARCPMPDHAPPPGAAFDYGIPDLNAAVKSYQEYAQVGGTGSWPKGCDPQRPDVHSTRVNLTTTAASSTQKGYLLAASKLVEKCEAEFGHAVRHIMDGDTSDCEHDVRFENIPGGVIGYNYFPTPNTCNQTVKGRLDNTFNSSMVTFANLMEHEYKGHGDGLEHTNGGIMNPSIITINPMTWKGDKHEKTKRKYFGGIPLDPTGPTDPPPPPPPGDPLYHGILVYEGKQIKLRIIP